MLESHTERLYGTTTENSSESESDSSRESSPPKVVLTKLYEHDIQGDSEVVSLHEQHEKFIQKQLQLATSYKEKREQLPRIISSKRSTINEEGGEDFALTKKAKLSLEAEKAIEQEAGLQRGPRTVSKAEKNRRRKLKKKRRLARKS